MNIKPYQRKAQYYETDQMGIIHHANYIHWFEEARVDFMEQVGYGYEQTAQAGVDFAVLSMACDYKSMVRFGDTVNVSVHIKSFTATRMKVSYQVVDGASGALRATGESWHCYYHNHKKRPVSLKKEMPALYDLFMGMMEDEKE